MSKLETPPSEALYPVPVVLVTCLDRAKSRANAITIAWCGIVASNPPQISVSIRPSRYSHKLIIAEKSFVVNIPTKDIMEKADLCGMRSGKDIDKFKACSFTQVPASRVSAPMIKECPVNIECALKEVLRLGSHDCFIGEVVCVHTDESVLNDSGDIDYAKARPFVFNQGEYWDLGKKIGYYGCSSKK